MGASKNICRPKKDFETTLGKTSYSEDKKTNLLDSEVKAYDFDKLCGSLKGLRGNCPLSSCDALVEKDDSVYLVEFKNQPNKNINNDEIQKKAFDSVAQLLVTWERDISQQALSKKLVLFVVYHNATNDEPFEKIRNKTLSFTKSDQTEPILFGINNDLTNLYKEVHTIDISDFLEKYYSEYFDTAQ